MRSSTGASPSCAARATRHPTPSRSRARRTSTCVSRSVCSSRAARRRLRSAFCS